MRAQQLRIACLILLGVGAGCSDPGQAEWEVAFDAEDTGWLLNVSGSSATDLYAVGGEPEAGAAMHFDGATWSPVAFGADIPLLTWTHTFGPDDVTMVGNEGTVMHWNGASWEQQATPTTENLWGVWGAAASDLWAVGGAGRQEGQATLLHYDGATWQAADIPDLQRANVWALFKVWGTSADNVYVVGQRGVVLHFDGSVWTELLVGASDDLISLWGTGPDHIVAVGGRGSGIISMWNGVEWKTESLAPLPGLNGVWLRDPKTIHAVGSLGTVVTIDAETLELGEYIVGTDLELHSVFGSGTELHAVGGNLLTISAPFRGRAYRRTLAAGE